jgi:reductive dehalogenase
MTAKKRGVSRRDFFGLMAGSGAALLAGNALAKDLTLDPASDSPAPRGNPPWVLEVDKPTYTKDIVGPIVKCDQRIHPINFSKLVPGDGHYEKIFQQYPELLPLWQALAPERDPDPVKAQRRGVSIPTFLAARINVLPATFLASPDAVTPKPSPKQVPVDDPADMSMRIKEMGRMMGAMDVKIGPLNQDWIYSIRGGDPGVTGVYPDYWGEPNVLNHKSAIVLAIPENLADLTDGDGPIANMRTLWAYTHGANMAVVLAQFISKLGYPVRAHHVADGQTPLVPLAVDAGMAELGRNGIAVHPTLGSHFRLAAVTTDMPLAYDKPIDFGLQDFCESCKICAEACPGGAIDSGPKRAPKDLATDGPRAMGVKKWLMDGIKCRVYWGNNGLSCYACMIACPWSKPDNWVHNAMRPLAARGGQPVATVMSSMERAFYGPFTKSPLKSWVK